MNVLIIPEDFRHDQFILKPIIRAMMDVLGSASAKVEVCQDPLLGGIRQAMRWQQIEEILDQYAGMVDLFLLCVDRDGDPGRRRALDRIEQGARKVLPERRGLLAENAWQEIEVWALAGQNLPAEWSWQAIRAEVNPKERYFLPFARLRGLANEPGEGRRTLAREAARRYPRVRRLCPEDIQSLERRIHAWIQSRA